MNVFKLHAVTCLLFTFSGCFIQIENFDIGTGTEEDVKNLEAKIAFTMDESPKSKIGVNFSFKAFNRSKVFLYLPENFLRKTELYNRIENLQLLSVGSISRHFNKPNIVVIEKPKNEPVVITYFLRNEGEESFFAPLLRDDFFQFVGGMVLLFPTFLLGNEKEAKIKIDVEWHMPTNFEIFNSFDVQKNHQSLNITISDLRDSLFLGGKNLSLRKIFIRENPVYIIFNGQWDYISYKDFVDLISSVLDIQRKTFEDENFPYYLVSLTQFKENCNGIVKFAGTAHVNSFRAYYPKKCPLKPEIKQLISHELMHAWIGKKLKVSYEKGSDKKWFSEGFTDYFGRIFALRVGAISLYEYFGLINNMLEKYYLLKSSDHDQLPYQQGEILALNLNKQIKERDKDKSLDNVIKDMIKIANQDGGCKVFSLEELDDIFKRYIPSGISEYLLQLKNGTRMSPPDFPGCSLASDKLFYKLYLDADCDMWLY